MKIIYAMFALLIVGTQTLTDGSPLIYEDLGFRYTPPANLCDSTAYDRETVQEKAAALHTTKVLDVRLSLQSLSEDTAAGWERIGIETYPREKLSELNDRDAILKVSRWVARIAKEEAVREVKVGDLHFTVLTFQLREGELVRLADVYTTIRRGRVISFSFSANSKSVLTRIEASIDSIDPIVSK